MGGMRQQSDMMDGGVSACVCVRQTSVLTVVISNSKTSASDETEALFRQAAQT